MILLNPDGSQQAYQRALNAGTIFALTSLSPALQNVIRTRQCIKSWRDAGMHVLAFNHPSEISVLAKLYDIDFVPVLKTSESIFGKHLVPINVMLDWAAEQNVPALIINADIELQLTDWELKRIRLLADGGLCCFIRYNHNGNTAYAERDLYGIDAFLFHGRGAPQFPVSFLSMGKPSWDYWLPYTFATRGHPIYTVEFPAAFHRNHKQHWSLEDAHRCALEFIRISGEPAGDQSIAACLKMSIDLAQRFGRQKIVVPQRPFQIREWVQQRFQYPGHKTFLELGARRGTDTAWMAEIPDVTLQHCPVRFGPLVEVELFTLDTIYQRHGLDIIDFIWADIQGGEGEMISGGRQALARTRYLYTEYSDDKLYERQATLREILALLPDFRVLELWPNNVLLENREFQGFSEP
jgi:hypothetical protein